MSWKSTKKKDRRIDRHHRRPKSRGGGSENSNISLVPRYKHVAFHQLFNTESPEEIALTLQKILDTLNEVWIDPAYKLIAVKRDE